MKKLFVLVRNDIPTSDQAVQAGHAVAKFMLTYPGLWSNEILVYLSVEDKEELTLWKYKTSNKFLDHSVFSEPDMNNEITAIALMCKDSFVGKLNLMGSN